MKKLLSILLAVLMVATLGVVNVTAEGEEPATETLTETQEAQVQSEGDITNIQVGNETELRNALSSNVDIITLQDDIALSSMLDITRKVTIDLDGKTLSMSNDYTKNNSNNDMLVQVNNGDAGKVIIQNGTINAGEYNKHALNIYDSNDVELIGLALVHNGYTGAPLVVNKSKVSLSGKMNITLGNKSWYAINVDNKGGSASLNMANLTSLGIDNLQGRDVIKSETDSSITLNNNVYPLAKTCVTEGTNTNVALYRSPIAQCGNDLYYSLKDAVAGVENGSTIKLLGDSVSTNMISIKKDITIDLNGYDITAIDSWCIAISDGNVVFQNSSSERDSTISISVGENPKINSSYSVVYIGNNGNGSEKKNINVTIDKGVTVLSDYCYGVTLMGSNSNETLTVNGTVRTTGESSAISGNGSEGLGNTNIIINGLVESDSTNAIYHPQSGKLTIDGEVTGLGALEMKSGTILSVGENARLVANGTPTHSPNSNGCSTSGYAVALVENPSYTGNASVLIDKGYFAGAVDILKDNTVAEDKKASIVITGGTFTLEPESKYLDEGYKVYSINNNYVVLHKPTEISADAVSIPQNADNFNELATKSVKYVWDNGGEHSNVEGLTFTVKSGDSVVVTDNKLSAVKTGTSVITVTGEGLSKDFEVTVTVGDPKAYFDENGLTVVYPADAQKFIDSMLKGVTYDNDITDSGFYNQIYLTYQGDYKMYGGFSNGKYIYNGEVVQSVDIIKANADKTGVTISIEDLVKYGVTDGIYKVEISNYMGASNVTKINLGTLEIATNKQIDTSKDRVQTLNINIDESAFNFKVGDAVADLNKVAKITDENGNPVNNVLVSWVKDSGIKSPAGETIYIDAEYAYKYAEDGTYDIVDTPNYDANTLYYLNVEYMPSAKKNYSDDFKIVLNGKEIEVNKKNAFKGAAFGIVTFRLWESTDYMTIVPVGYAAAKVDYPVGVSEDVIKDKLVSIFIETNGVVNNSKQLEYVSESNTPASNAALKEIVGDGGMLTVALRSASFEETKKDDGSSTVTMSKLVFDVAPVSSDGTVIHGKLSKAITFRLPVDPATTSKYANVYHEGEFLAQYEIKTDADGNKYIEVTNDEFSVYSYELTNTVYSTGSSSDSSSSSNSSSSSSQTSYKKPVVNTSVK